MDSYKRYLRKVFLLDESKELLVRSHEKLRSARLLFENQFYGDCVSRAYYAMFYAARSLLSFRKIYPRTHGGVIRILGLEFVTRGYLDEISGRAIATAKENREEADYGIISGMCREEAERTLIDAEDIVNGEKLDKKLGFSA